MDRHHHPTEDLARTGRLGRTVRRRTFLVDLGRVTLGAVVLGPALAACSDGQGDDATADATAADATAADASSAGTPADVSPSDAEPTGPEGAGGGDLTWVRADLGFVSAYVLVRDGEVAVFDTGTGADTAPIGDALEAAGVGWGDVGAVIVSHRHEDHVGGLSQVAELASDAVTYAGMPDLDSFRDVVERAEEVGEGDRVLGLRIVATPGHTLGHVCAFDETTGVLLAGDAIVRDRQIGGTTGEGIEASPPSFTADAAQALASVGVLADLTPATILFGHGDPLTEDAATQLSDYAATL